MTLARRLVQGVDVWLNTPRRPLEASGTSGMKAALNGVLNCSILDGWWAEAYSPACGFAIGGPRPRSDRGRAGRGGRRGALRRARGAGAPGVLRARRGRAAAALDRSHARVDRRARAALRHGTDGDGVRRAALPAGARGRAGGREPRRPSEDVEARRPEARLPSPLPPSGGGSSCPHAAARAEQHEQARPEQPDRRRRRSTRASRSGRR